ncbi:hypothetical protein KY285_023659 [Solanum tuberosum]|nr:hypothetical protein KY289_023990 [Solanum tuberosum]KAH0675858.1 hypothetical protein KY285_023659 [Solanum tuberosum]
MKAPPDIDWEDTITTQLLELLTQNISTIFRTQSRGLPNVDIVRKLLKGENVFNIGRPVVFAKLPCLVYYTLLEMVCVLREAKPALPVVEAMWWLLILDLNLVHACKMKGYHLVELCSQESLGGNSFGLNHSQSKIEASENTHSNPNKQ